MRAFVALLALVPSVLQAAELKLSSVADYRWLVKGGTTLSLGATTPQIATSLDTYIPWSDAVGGRFVDSLFTTIPLDKGWKAQTVQIAVVGKDGKWSTKSEERFTTYQDSNKIAIGSGYIPVEGAASLYRIVATATDTANNGTKSIGANAHQILGDLLLGTAAAPTKPALWYGAAIGFKTTGDQISLSRVAIFTERDSLKATERLANLNPSQFDSLKVQLVRVEYTGSGLSTGPTTTIIQTTKPAEIATLSALSAKGRVLRVAANSPIRQLLNIFNSKGEIVQSWQFTLESGLRDFQLENNRFPAGNYFGKLYNESGATELPFIIP